MEWHIMNAGGITSLCSSLGSVEQGTFLPSDDCEDALQELIGQFEQDNVLCTLQQMFCTGIVEKDLVPLIKYLDDDPEIFAEAVRLMTLLTQPVECMQHQGKIQVARELAKSQATARESCFDEVFLTAVFNEVYTIIKDSGEYSLMEESVVNINNCLLLLRNILYHPDMEKAATEQHTQHLLLTMTCGLGDLILTLLGQEQRENWSLVLIQILPLLYKTTVNEFIQPNSESVTISDQPSDKVEPLAEVIEDKECCGSTRSKGSLSSLRECLSTCVLEVEQSLKSDWDKSELWLNQDRIGESSGSCHTAQDGGSEGTGDNSELWLSPDITESSGSSHTTKDDSSEACCEEPDQDQQLKQMLHNFTVLFIKTGFCNLISDVTNIITCKHGEVDDLPLLWAISFFCKFSRCEIICMENIREILKLEMFGFITYESVLHCEEVLRGSKPDSVHSHVRKLHLCVTGLNELLKMLFDTQKGEQLDPQKDLDKLHRDIASLSDLRRLFVFLTRKFDIQHYMYSIQFMKDLVSANHQYLLLTESWIKKGYGLKNFSMLDHVRQFATVDVMQRYGYLLQNFSSNSLYINNCILTMMHHIAGDCQRSDVLIQANIINMFLLLLDNESLDQEITDLIEYVLQQFVKYAESNPYVCASQMFGDGKDPPSPCLSDVEDSEWTMEDDDILMMQFMELSGEKDLITKIQQKFEDFGKQKQKVEILTRLMECEWLQDCEKENLMVEVTDAKPDRQAETTGKKRKHEVLEHKMESNEDQQEMEETGVVTFCAKKLRKTGHGKHVSWLQDVLCEATYIKLCAAGEAAGKDSRVEEPVLKYHILQKKSMPLVFYDLEQEHMMNDNHFCLLLEHLGIHMPNDVNRLFPRIPFFWSAKQLFDKAQQLGPLNEENLKFKCQDMCNVKEGFEEFSSEFGESSYKSSKAVKHAELTDRVAHSKLFSESLWTSFVQSYNLQLLSS